MWENCDTTKMKLFACNSNPNLAKGISEYTGIPIGRSQVVRFSDGEININIEESVRGADTFVVQSTSSPANEHIMEMLIMVDALKRASAKSINLVVPYYGYARQDRKARARDPITAKLIANLIEKSGADRIICMDLHAGQIQGFFDIPLDHLVSMPIIAEYFASKGLEDIVVVSPDHGGVTRTRNLAQKLNAPIAIIDKRRPAPNVAEIMHIIGDIKGKTCILIDDIIDTAGTITLAANALKANGAKAVYAACTHPVLSGPAIERLENSAIEELVVTDTIYLPEEKMISKIAVLSVAPLIGEAIIRIHERLSISKLFD
ncbi:ribose-phosphate pyrophosphokinase [Desulfuribacillus stibiiarsenatis]|uniref:Ribose-phosphate pyrophosphokinase n=1 Tax=Desulfuribacillus stibiiarsenatis TaxID=1390249 RepID=A0A1E5L327_9FIRM|nr:ribose-phosphate diphosphokinase [Desulfuribacillus stibiiarsenatis]OEH84339.1 ribose-phosphate pyrophosphokinase [Desulfuribacillus stibiiarsenatis]